MYKLFLAIPILILASCASDSELTILTQGQIEVAKAQASVQQPPTLQIKCNNELHSCSGLNVSYIDPRDRQKVDSYKIKNSNDVLIETVPSVLKTMGTLGIVYGASEIIKNVGTKTSINGDNNSQAGGNIAGDNTVTDTVDTATAEDNSVVTTTTNTTTNTDDNSSQDSVSTPTVVAPTDF